MEDNLWGLGHRNRDQTDIMTQILRTIHSDTSTPSLHSARINLVWASASAADQLLENPLHLSLDQQFYTLSTNSSTLCTPCACDSYAHTHLTSHAHMLYQLTHLSHPVCMVSLSGLVGGTSVVVESICFSPLCVTFNLHDTLLVPDSHRNMISSLLLQ